LVCIGNWAPKNKPLRFRFGGLFRAEKRGAEGQSRTDTGLPRPVFELVAVRTIRFRQARYVPQSCLDCTDAFHMTSGNIKPLYDVLYDGIWLWIPSQNRCGPRSLRRVIPEFPSLDDPTWKQYRKDVETVYVSVVPLDVQASHITRP